MLENIVIDVDEDCVPFPKKPKKVVANVNYKFKEIWVMKMPWAKPIFNNVGLVCIVRCCVCTKIERRKKIWLLIGIPLKTCKQEERF
jgi:hypothetical protein